jgi:hypothetical protein
LPKQSIKKLLMPKSKEALSYRDDRVLGSTKPHESQREGSENMIEKVALKI